MSDDYQAMVDAFLAQGERVAGILDALTPSQWNLPTRLPGWSVLTLVAHLTQAPDSLVSRMQDPVATPATQDRVTYWNFTGSEVAPLIDIEARQVAAVMEPKTAAGEFRSSLDRVRHALARVSPSAVVPLLFGAIEVEELVAARILEVTVHSLDLAAALALPPDLDENARRYTAQLLAALLGSRPPGYEDDVAFIEAASGRGPGRRIAASAFR